MIEALGNVNWIAAAVAAVVWFVLGAAWYINPFIARKWQESGGIEVPEDQGPDPMVFLYTLIAYFVASVVTAMLAVATGVSSLGEGAALGLTVGVGYALTAAAVTSVYDQKPNPFTWFWINGVFNVIGLTAVGAIIGAFA
jgi:hypothetical protein